MILLLVIVIALTVRFVPPAHMAIVILLIMLVTATVCIITSYTGSRRIQVAASTFTFLQLSINYVIGFDLLNTILLLSFIIALTKLFK